MLEKFVQHKKGIEALIQSYKDFLVKGMMTKEIIEVKIKSEVK